MVADRIIRLTGAIVHVEVELPGETIAVFRQETRVRRIIRDPLLRSSV